ncbi:MAG: FtsX-like permease family protein [Alphaproteobacteria bacterium]|nr:FtsX-like permease family protein [Alphaproteobacteria bacterium]
MQVLDRKLYRDLRRIWLQALAIALVIGCGVAMYVMSLGTLRSLDETRTAYYERYRFAQVFASVKRAPEGLARKIAAIPGVARVETRIVSAVTLDIAGMAEPARGLLVSVPERHAPALNGLHLRVGRYIEPDRTGEVVLNEAFAQAHGLLPGDSLHAIINGRKRGLNVVGVALSPEYIYSLGPGAIMPDDRSFGVMWVGRETLAAAYDLEDSFNDVSLTLMRGASESQLIADLDRLLEPYGGVGAYGRKDQTSHWYISNELVQLQSMGTVAPLIFLGVAAFLLHIVISRLIATEREQIGLLKAFGYSGRAVAWHYAKLMLAIVSAGVLLGFAGGAWLGRGLTEIYTEFFRFPFLYYSIDTGTFAVAALISFGAGLVGTLGAVRHAALLPPAVAMQPAPPPVYRKTLMERLGLDMYLAQVTRMILRHLMRRPVRSGLTTLGIAMSAAILISSMFMMDSIELIIDVQFNRIHRQDVTVSLVEAKPARILRDFEQMPGVMRAEPVRAVAVRIRNGHVSRRTALIGLSAAGDLGRVIDRDLRPVSMPPSGLVLSAKLADVLGVGRGDKLRVEAMEGRRPVGEIAVSAVVQEFIGTSAYMDLRALNRFMGEPPMVSLAYLQTDSRFEQSLYTELKDAPAVAGVTIEAAAVESFRETLAENMLLMTSFNVLFAGMIAFGVVYNSARISLSERGRELASLRVLGFTRAEVSWILLGEFALLTVAALVPGFLIGYGLAWSMSLSFETELFRIPLVVSRETYGFSALVVIASATVTGLVVRRRIDRLDLVAVLKTRE